MLRWAVREFPELRGRIVLISRGGTEGWARGLDAQYIDILSLFSTEEFAAHRALSDKQRQVQEFELRVIDAVKAKLGCSEAAVLHPMVLYRAYFRFLKINQLAYPRSLAEGSEGVDGLASIYKPIEVPELGPELDFLPDDYVAVRFYSSASFPDQEAARRFASQVVNGLARRTNVVLLGHPFEIDDHGEVQRDVPTGVFSVQHLMRPENNLAIQTPVIGHAKAFIGTYGGFSYLAPFLGVPSLSFSVDRGRTLAHHQVLAQRLFDGPGWGDFVSLRHSDLPLIELVVNDPQARSDSIDVDGSAHA